MFHRFVFFLDCLGPSCAEYCPNNCANNNCNFVQICTDGCEDGWTGDQCETRMYYVDFVLFACLFCIELISLLINDIVIRIIQSRAY